MLPRITRITMVTRTVLLVVMCLTVVAAFDEQDGNEGGGQCIDGCPDGSRCLAGACITVGDAEPNGSSRLPLLAAKASRRGNLRSTFCRRRETVECQDHTWCPTGYSCCHSPEYPVGTYTCCPYEYSPVCCADGTCCAQGYRCEPRWGICTPEVGTQGGSSGGSGDSGNTSTGAKTRRTVDAGRGPRAMLSPSLERDDESNAWLECPDGSFCHHGSTCCPSSSRSSPSAGSGGPGYSCCPHEEAQCCEDREHCCPRGTRCLRSRRGYRCLVGSAWRQSLPALRKYSSFKDESYPWVPCPTWMVCSTGQCCRDQYGAYRCSPYVDGVCCASGIVGCPAGMECASGM